ncbi:MAG: hypothetical protein KAR01_02740, partial [Desulfocapsa sp.]|nr:hypothetical protein [Desulfocapsa sp.]
DDAITEPEDSLPIMLDALFTLINEDKEGSMETRYLQDQLLLQFLIPTTEQINKNISTNPEAKFYQKCIDFLAAYLELERGLTENDIETI